jgi:hypothetical protein
VYKVRLNPVAGSGYDYNITNGSEFKMKVDDKEVDNRSNSTVEVSYTMEELFKIFPDSAVHVGDRWKLSSIQKDEISLNVKNTYLLKDIHNGIAIIESEGEISSDNTVGNSMGYSFTADIKEKREGEFEMETTTGMLLNSRISSDIEGEMPVMGRKVPITSRTTITMEGKKVK